MKPGRVLHRSLCFILVILYCSRGAAYAAPGAEELAVASVQATDEQLAEINRRVEEISARVEMVSVRRAKLEKDRQHARAQLDKQKSALRSLEDRLREIEQERSRTRQEITRIEERSRELWEVAVGRLRAFYLFYARKRGMVHLARSSEHEVGRLAFALKRLAEFDRNLFSELKETASQHALNERSLEKLAQESETTKERAKAQSLKLSTHVADLEKLVKDVRLEQEREERELASLRAEALRLETVISGVTGLLAPETGEYASAGLTAVPRSQAKQAGPGTVLSLGSAASVAASEDLKGLAHLRGKLSLPGTGQVLAVSKQKPGFGNLLVRKGVEIELAGGHPAAAVSAGIVAFVGSMPGYGNVMIIDHGARWYALYAGFREHSVSRGDRVLAGQPVVSGPAEGSWRVYFEIREKGKAVDTARFLSR